MARTQGCTSPAVCTRTYGQKSRSSVRDLRSRWNILVVLLALGSIVGCSAVQGGPRTVSGKHGSGGKQFHGGVRLRGRRQQRPLYRLHLQPYNFQHHHQRGNRQRLRLSGQPAGVAGDDSARTTSPVRDQLRSPDARSFDRYHRNFEQRGATVDDARRFWHRGRGGPTRLAPVEYQFWERAAQRQSDTIGKFDQLRGHQPGDFASPGQHQRLCDQLV